MKVTAFNGSPRRDGNTALMLQRVLDVLGNRGIETELVQVGGELVHGCTACMTCREKQDGRCVIDNDPTNKWIAAMAEPDGILLGSPTYFADLTPEMKALIDRAGFVLRPQGALKRKVGAAVVAVRRCGALHVFDSINHFFLINEMLVPGASYWNMGFGGGKGEVEQDDEGMKTMSVLGENMAWLLERVQS